MSFILDALKKSESDRQRQSGPSLFEVKVAPPRRALPLWAVAIAVLLGINVIVISWMLLRHPASQQAATVGTAPAAAPPSAMVDQGVAGGTAPVAARSSQATAPDTLSGRSPPGSARPPGSNNDATSAGDMDAGGGPGGGAGGPDRGAGAGAGGGPSAGGGRGSGGAATARATAGASLAAVAPPAAARAASTRQSASAAAPLAGTDTSASQAPGSDDSSDDAPAVEPAAGAGTGASGAAAGDLPLYQQIVGNDGLPSLHLDLHVFADRPKDRFVMINMHRLGEGDTLPNGVQVNAIRPDGVVLSYHGTRFLLPRN